MASVAQTRSLQAPGAIFARAAGLLATSAGYHDTLQKTLAACLPDLGDYGFFDARDEATILRATQWVHQARVDINLCALSTGLAALHDDTDDDWYRRVALGEEHLAPVRSLAFRSMITVPMRCRGELIGA